MDFFFFVPSVMRFHHVSVVDEGNNWSMAFPVCSRCLDNWTLEQGKLYNHSSSTSASSMIVLLHALLNFG